MQKDLITIVIPAFNAAQTIGRTLASVRGQTHNALEIIVVDDGSTDGTAALVEQTARDDPRVRLIRQFNAGVATARNVGWIAGRADCVAFIDADDLWHVAKLERQLAVLNGDAAVGLVYSGYQTIDWFDRCIGSPTVYAWAGDVLQRLFLGNFIGNGSAALIRRTVLEAVGGFDPGLRNADAQGCEDWQFYCRAAERTQFGVVARADVGYRIGTGTMSGDSARMLKSWMLVHDEMLARHAANRLLLATGLRSCAKRLIEQATVQRHGSLVSVLAMLALLARRYPGVFSRVVYDAARAILSPVRSAARPGGPFAYRDQAR